jgi:hypothetical protein
MGYGVRGACVVKNVSKWTCQNIAKSYEVEILWYQHFCIILNYVYEDDCNQVEFLVG